MTCDPSHAVQTGGLGWLKLPPMRNNSARQLMLSCNHGFCQREIRSSKIRPSGSSVLRVIPAVKSLMCKAALTTAAGVRSACRMTGP
jgi:hypothetical protein